MRHTKEGTFKFYYDFAYPIPSVYNMKRKNHNAPKIIEKNPKSITPFLLESSIRVRNRKETTHGVLF